MEAVAEKPKTDQKSKPSFISLPSQSITNDKGNTVERVSVSGLSQPPEVARKVAEIIKRHGGHNEAAKKELAEYHEQLKANSPVDSVVSVPQVDETRRYLLAVASVLSGQFDHLPHDRLVDIAALSVGPIRDFESWRSVAQLMRSPPV